MHQQFNIQQLYALPTLYLCVLYLSENKQRLVLLINSLVFITEMKSVYCAVRTGSLNTAACASFSKVNISPDSYILQPETAGCLCLLLWMYRYRICLPYSISVNLRCVLLPRCCSLFWHHKLREII
jgi:hypothetical protein